MRIYIFGSGKVGRALLRAARASGLTVTARAARRGLPTRRIEADLVILAVRDRDVLPTATALAQAKRVGPKTACVHVAGALDAEALAPLRAVSAGVAQMHPMIAFASLAHVPSVAGGHVHVRGDAAAERRARAFAKAIGMFPRTFPELDPVGYHAAAGLVANGATALAAIGAELLARSGVPAEVAPKMLGPLLRSVAENVDRLGFPGALTGPVRRGDASGLARHLETLRARLPAAVALYLASAEAQLPLARALGEAEDASFAEIAALLRKAKQATSRS